jgi:hypothetical protein
MAATWSWGAAVGVAIAVMHTKGLIPFLAWMGANMVAIPIFGAVYYYVPTVRKWQKLLPMLALWGFIGFFAIVMNLSVLKAALGGGQDIVVAGMLQPQQALYVTLAVGLLIAWYIHVKGFRGSVFTDIGQLTLQFLGVIGIIVMGAIFGTGQEVPMMVGDQSSWMTGAVLGLVTGTTASGMQWQRILSVESDADKLKSALWGGGIFTVFMILTAIAGYLFWDGSLVVALPFLLSVLAVATSTADSGSALLQYISQRMYLPVSVGSITTIGAVLIFPMVSEWGITGIWTFYASTRWKVVAGLFVLTLLYNSIPKLHANEPLHELGRKFHFILNDPVYGSENDEQPAGDETVAVTATDDD